MKVNKVGEISRESTHKARKTGKGCSVKALCRQRRIVRQDLAVLPNAMIIQQQGELRGGVVIWRPRRDDGARPEGIPPTLRFRSRSRSWVLIPSGSCDGGLDRGGVISKGSTRRRESAGTST